MTRGFQNTPYFWRCYCFPKQSLFFCGTLWFWSWFQNTSWIFYFLFSSSLWSNLKNFSAQSKINFRATSFASGDCTSLLFSEIQLHGLARHRRIWLGENLSWCWGPWIFCTPVCQGTPGVGRWVQLPCILQRRNIWKSNMCRSEHNPQTNKDQNGSDSSSSK